MQYDIIIIGSGLGGLACGSILAKNGRKVLVLEQGTQPGGCLQSYSRHGLKYDTGFHYVGGLAEGQSLHAAFGYLGLLDLPWQRLDEDCFDKITIGDETFRLAGGYEQYAEKLAERFPEEREALRGYARLLRQSAESQFANLAQTDSADSLMPADMEQSAWQYLNDTFHSPLLIGILSGTCLKMELRKETLPLFTFLHGNSGYIESSWRLKGDGSLIAGKLISTITENGGEVLCRAKVVELIEEDGIITKAVCEDGREFRAETFISDIHLRFRANW